MKKYLEYALVTILILGFLSFLGFLLFLDSKGTYVDRCLKVKDVKPTGSRYGPTYYIELENGTAVQTDNVLSPGNDYCKKVWIEDNNQEKGDHGKTS